MSGGVDSSVAAALLVRAGCDVVGVFMRRGAVEDDHRSRTGDARRQGCCSLRDATDARLVAAELGIPFYVCDFTRGFARVIDDFVEQYAAGRTPNPCIRCNDWLKFGRLRDIAGRIGASFVASGHYARIEHAPAGCRLLRAADHAKDQSYVLFGTPRDALAAILLPVGEYPKQRVRDMARRFGLPVFDKPDSQELCFAPPAGYADLVERRRPHLAATGLVLDTAGRTVGTHSGHHRFTIGQRRGVGLALGAPAYVVRKDPRANTVTIGTRRDLLASGCSAMGANWLVEPPSRWRACRAQVRAHARPTPARVRALPGAGLEVRFSEPLEAVAPGQAVVCFAGDVLIGGGWIEQVFPSADPSPAVVAAAL
jgi:tRNA-specific 2-thiouridylase